MFQLLALCQSEGEQLPLEISDLKRFTVANYLQLLIPNYPTLHIYF